MFFDRGARFAQPLRHMLRQHRPRDLPLALRFDLHLAAQEPELADQAGQLAPSGQVVHKVSGDEADLRVHADKKFELLWQKN